MSSPLVLDFQGKFEPKKGSFEFELFNVGLRIAGLFKGSRAEIVKVCHSKEVLGVHLKLLD
jgi:hypothetical protein